MKKEFREMLREKGLAELPNVLLASAECEPLSKTGGLADVVGTLPKSLAKLGIDARVITPYHRVIKDKYADRVEHMFDFYCTLGWRQAYVGVEKLVLDGVTIYLIDNEQYFGDKIYRGGQAEGEQYAFFLPRRARLHPESRLYAAGAALQRLAHRDAADAGKDAVSGRYAGGTEISADDT